MDERIWERQLYDTQASYRAFQAYYLLQKDRPRTLLKAYREYLLNERGVPEEDLKSKKVADGIIKKWFEALDNDGNRIPNSHTWEERAIAFDNYNSSLIQNAHQYKRAKIESTEYENYLELLDIWSDMFDSVRSYVREELETRDNVNPTAFISPLERLMKWREDIATFGRRSVAMPSKINDYQSEAGEQTVGIVWQDPLGDDDDIGLGAEELNDNIELREVQRRKRYAEDEEVNAEREWSED